MPMTITSSPTPSRARAVGAVVGVGQRADRDPVVDHAHAVGRKAFAEKMRAHIFGDGERAARHVAKHADSPVAAWATVRHPRAGRAR